MTPRDGDSARFRDLPAPVRPGDTVESVDTSVHPVPDPNHERDRLLREAGG